MSKAAKKGEVLPQDRGEYKKAEIEFQQRKAQEVVDKRNNALRNSMLQAQRRKELGIFSKIILIFMSLLFVSTTSLLVMSYIPPTKGIVNYLVSLIY